MVLIHLTCGALKKKTKTDPTPRDWFAGGLGMSRSRTQKVPEFQSSQLLPQSEPHLVASGNAKEGDGPYLQGEALYQVSGIF